MRKQFKIFLIFTSTFLLFTITFSNYIYADPITDESLYPKITSIAPTTVRVGDIVEVAGENFNNLNIMAHGSNPIGTEIGIALTPVPNYYNPDCSRTIAKIISFSNNKMIIKIECSTPGEASVSLDYHSISGAVSDSYGPRFTIKAACKTGDDWNCTDWSSCSELGVHTRTCVKSGECESLNTPIPDTMGSCIYIPFCASNNWSCTDWNICSVSGQQTRTCNKTSNCQGGVTAPATSQSCTYKPVCTYYSWSCGTWSTCSSNGTKTRECNKILNCEGGTQSPETIQSCAYIPTCSEDTWQCGNWGTCSPQGVQTRSCNRTYDCPAAETAAPATSISCQAVATQPNNSNNNLEANINREKIIKATVKLKCPVDKLSGYLGSGTIIDEYGTILTNRHVVMGTVGACYVGFINNEDDTPSYNEIADVKKISSDYSANGDIAILKIRNNSNKKFEAINIFQGNSNNLKSGDTILPFGYPDEDLFGATITFTEGPYAGRGTTLAVCNGKFNVSSFFKTTATIDHGNSGGGAYQKKTGYFMGIPTLGTSCKPEIPSRVNYILSINTIKSWLNSMGSGYNVSYNNFGNLGNYYKETVPIENIDLNSLKILDSSMNSSNETSSSELTPTDKNIATKLKGKILLQVESHGEAWYVNPKTGSKHYMADGNEAYRIMRYLGVGITNKNLEKIKANKSFAKKNSGKIFLQVEANGEAYYIDFSGNAHYLKDGSAAYSVMRDLGLGIKNTDLSKIMEGSL